MIYAAIDNDKQTFSYLFYLGKNDNKYYWINSFYANGAIAPEGQYFRLIKRNVAVMDIKINGKMSTAYICDFHEDDLNLPLILGDERAAYKYFQVEKNGNSRL